MDEKELMSKIILSFCDAVELDFVSKKMIMTYVDEESHGKTHGIQKSIIKVHDMIHDFEREHLRGL